MTELVRINKVGGRYLIFDVEDVATLRRKYSISAVFIGTIPQSPSQILFSGLPIELLAEEAKLLVDTGAAYLVDDATSHLSHLTAADPAFRQAYLESLRTRRYTFSRALIEQQQAKLRESAKWRARNQESKQVSTEGDDPQLQDENVPPITSLLENKDEGVLSMRQMHEEGSPPFISSSMKQRKLKDFASPTSSICHLTPTTSNLLLDPKLCRTSVEGPGSYPLYRYLNTRSYYISPGLRFGANYSVYPGDPFRYHAHFMATNFDWNEEINLIDIVSGGRLGTAVKKGFVIGGQAPQNEAEGSADDVGECRTRAFTIEWAIM